MLTEKQHRLRIPSFVWLPFGYTVQVKQLCNTAMDKLADDADGLWDDSLKTIYLRKSLPIARRRYLLAHELGHAWLDWQHKFLDEGAAKN